MRVTFDGLGEVTLPDGSVVVGDASEDHLDEVTLERVAIDEEVQWEVRVPDLGSVPNSPHRSGMRPDYLCRYWPHEDVLILVGEAAVVLIDAADGTVRAREELAFSSKASLDVTAIELTLDGKAAVVSSSFRLVLFGPTTRVVDLGGLLTKPPVLTSDAITAECYDFDSELGTTKTVTIPW